MVADGAVNGEACLASELLFREPDGNVLSTGRHQALQNLPFTLNL